MQKFEIQRLIFTKTASFLAKKIKKIQFCITVFMIYSHIILFQSVYVINIFRLFKTATAAGAQSQLLLLRHTSQSSFGVFRVAIINDVQRGFDLKQHTIHCYIVLQFSSISQAAITFNHCQQIKFKNSRQSIKNARSTRVPQSRSFCSLDSLPRHSSSRQ